MSDQRGAASNPRLEERRGLEHARPRSGRVLASYVVLVSASHVLWVSFASVTLAAAHAYKTSDTSIGLLVTVGPLCTAALSIVAGVLPDRVGYRTPLLWAGAATALFAFARPLAPGFPALLVLTIGMLLPQPFLINAVADLVNRHFPENEAATATGIGTMAIFLGITVGVAVTPPLVDAVGVRGSQLVYASFAALALVAFWRLTASPVPDRMTQAPELGVREALARVLRSRTQWTLSAVIFCGFGFYLGLTAWLEEMLRPRGIGSSGAGVVAGMITLAGIAGSVALGALSDRVGRRKPFLVLAALVAAPCLWFIGHSASFGLLVGVAGVMGFFLLAALPVAIAMISEDRGLGPQVASTGVGVILMVGNLGGVGVVAAMGALKGPRGDFGAAVALTVALALAAAVVALALPETARRD